MSTEVIHTNVMLVPHRDGSMVAEPAREALVSTTDDGTDVFTGEVLTRLAFWTERYNVSTMRMDRTLVDKYGITEMPPVLRHGSIEVGDDYASEGNVIWLCKVDGQWTGHATTAMRDAFAEMRRHYGLSGFIPEVPFDRGLDGCP